MKYIFNFIGYKSKILRIFAYSKYYQNRLEINIANYCKIYLDSLDFELNKYIYRKDFYYKKDTLIKDYNYFIYNNNFKKDEFENIINIILNSKAEKRKKNYINIESPLLGIALRTNDFEKYYMIIVHQDNINKPKIKEDYSYIFQNLNTSKIKYSVCYIFNETTKLDDILELNINFNNVKKVNYIYNDYKPINNNISKNAIDILKQFQQLEQLVLGGGNSDIIKILETIYFEELKELQLSWNEISNIKLLEKVKIYKLELLNLSHNLLTDINVLENINLAQLKELDLSFKKISDIEVLSKVEFNELEKLDLSYNEIININVLENDKFKKLKELDLYHNKISDIKVFAKVKFDNLEKLNLGDNPIPDKNILKKVCFKKIKELNLS